jgi:hypothetical protein
LLGRFADGGEADARAAVGAARRAFAIDSAAVARVDRIVEDSAIYGKVVSSAADPSPTDR